VNSNMINLFLVNTSSRAQ